MNKEDLAARNLVSLILEGLDIRPGDTLVFKHNRFTTKVTEVSEMSVYYDKSGGPGMPGMISKMALNGAIGRGEVELKR